MFVNISACPSQASFQFENRNPDPITSSLSAEVPDLKSQWDHIYFLKQMINIDHPLSTITVSYYFSHILYVPTEAARCCIYVLKWIPTALQTLLVYVMLILTAWSDTANSCWPLLSCTLLVWNIVPWKLSSMNIKQMKMWVLKLYMQKNPCSVDRYVFMNVDVHSETAWR